VDKYADAVQIRARNMQNFDILGSRQAKNRSSCADEQTILELLMSARPLPRRNINIILCERYPHVRDKTRNTLT
jgi:3-deoxy-D-arabino-heptulosonate 7-phosphate (DAHP) synthase